MTVNFLRLQIIIIIILVTSLIVLSVEAPNNAWKLVTLSSVEKILVAY